LSLKAILKWLKWDYLEMGASEIMALKNNGISKELREIIKRLEDARDSAVEFLGSSDVKLQSDDLYADAEQGIEGAESAFLVAEQQIDEMTQVMSEEIDNLWLLLERVEEESS
jgi:hypothetical protein